MKRHIAHYAITLLGLICLTAAMTEAVPIAQWKMDDNAANATVLNSGSGGTGLNGTLRTGSAESSLNTSTRHSSDRKEGTGSLNFVAASYDQLSSTGICMTNGSEFVVYTQSHSSFTVNLSAASGTKNCRFYNVRTGAFESTFQVSGGGTRTFNRPTATDWVLHIY